MHVAAHVLWFVNAPGVPGFATTTRVVQVTSGSEVWASMALAPAEGGISLDVRVLDADTGAPLPLATVQATGVDRTVNVDLQKSTSGGAFASITTTDIEIDDSTTIRTAVASTLSNTSLSDGDILRAVVTVAGSADAQATGLMITLTLREDPA